MMFTGDVYTCVQVMCTDVVLCIVYLYYYTHVFLIIQVLIVTPN